MATFTGYTHYPGSAEIYPAGLPQNLPNTAPYETYLQSLQRLVNRQGASGGTSPWASVIQMLSQPKGTRTTNTGATGGILGQPVTNPLTAPVQSGVNPATGRPYQEVLTGATTAPFQSLSAERSPAIGAVTGPLFSDWSNLRTATQANQDKFRSAYDEFLPQSRSNVTQENSVVSRYFDDSIKKDLADLRATTAAARDNALKVALGDARRGLNISQLATPTGTGASVGGGSYRDRQEMDVASRLRTEAAMQDAAQQRSDFDYLNTAQLALRGARSDAERQYLQDVLLPQQTDAASFNTIMQALTPLANVDLANRISGVQGPGGFVGDSFGGVQSAYAQDLARRTGIQQFNAQQNLALQQAQMAQQLGLAQLPIAMQQAQNEAFGLRLRQNQTTQPAGGTTLNLINQLPSGVFG